MSGNKEDFDASLEEPTEGPRVLGLGVGLFLLILLWSLAFLAMLTFSRLASFTSTVVFSLTLLVTVLALAWPRFPAQVPPGQEALPRDKFRIYDTPFIWRTVLIIILGLSVIGAGVSSLMKHCVEQVYAEPVRKKAPRLESF